MSRFANLFRGHLAAVHEHEFAQSVTVTTPDGTATPTPAVLSNPSVQTRRTAHGTTRVMHRRCRFTRLTTVRHDATVTIDGTDWQIEDTLAVVANGCGVNLIRTLATEPSRNGYRR